MCLCVQLPQGRLDLRHTASGLAVRVLVTHQRGNNKAQLAALRSFALADAPAGLVVVCGDFNEDFDTALTAGAAMCAAGTETATTRPQFHTLDRNPEAKEPVVSRPPHKQDPSQRSGKGMHATQSLPLAGISRT